MDIKTLYCKSRNINALIALPSSKSISNRLLIIQALCKDSFEINGLSDANDTVLMHTLLSKIDNNESTNNIELNAQDAGTVLRFLAAYCSLKPGSFLLTGSKRMQERPIGILVDALRELGANIQYVNKEGFPPIQINGNHLSSKKLRINSKVSSQFISALLLISPLLENGLHLRFDNKPKSFPYIEMTLKLMQEFGIKLRYTENEIEVKAGNYSSTNIEVEADWSSAAFFYQSLAFAERGQLLLKGLKLDSIQGDAILAELFEELGIKTTKKEDGILLEKSQDINYNISIDFSQTPDLALPVIATCAGLGVIGSFTGLESLRIKESNRIIALETQLEKLGFDFRETDENEWVLINSCKVEKQDYDFRNTIIDTFDDHRVAMSFAPFAILGKGIQIQNPKVVAKSFPEFWNVFTHALK